MTALRFRIASRNDLIAWRLGSEQSSRSRGWPQPAVANHAIAVNRRRTLKRARCYHRTSLRVATGDSATEQRSSAALRAPVDPGVVTPTDVGGLASTVQSVPEGSRLNERQSTDTPGLGDGGRPPGASLLSPMTS